MAQPRSRMIAVLLGVFFFFAEAASAMIGSLACTVLVKRAGAQYLPWAYVALNLAMIPIILLAMLRPPRSSYRAVRFALVGYLAALALVMPAANSSWPWALVAIYVVARAGKLFWTTFAVGLVTEALPLREAKVISPRLVACEATGTILGGLLLKPAVALLGMTSTLFVFWCALALALAAIVALGASLPPLPPEPPPRESAGDDRGIWVSLWASFSELLASPLPRMIALINLFVTGLRYLIEFNYAGALARYFPTEQAMAGFTGMFDASMEITIIVVQLTLVGWLMRKIRVGGMAMVMPGLLVASTLAATVSGAFPMLALCQFFWQSGCDGFNKPSRQMLLGAVPAAQAVRVPTLMTVAGIVGSVATSLLLIPLAWIDNPHVTAGLTCALSCAFLVVASRAGRTYTTSLSATLDKLASEGRAQVLRAVRVVEEAERGSAAAELLDSADPAVRLEAVKEVGQLVPRIARELLSDRLGVEGDATVKSALLSALAPWRPPGLAEMLERMLADPAPRVRANALEALAFCTDGLRAGGTAAARVAAALSASTPRERAAAIIAAVRGAAAPELTGLALDTLSAMLAPASPEADRAAATAAMGRLGYPFFLVDVEAMLGDPAPSVRTAAVSALLRMQTPRAQRAVDARLAIETDPEVRARLSEAADRLRDENVHSVLEVIDELTGEERKAVSRALAAGAGDRRMTLLRHAVTIEHPRVRAELISLVQAIREEELVGVLLDCTHPGDPSTRFELAPLLGYLRTRVPEHAPQGYDVLRRLVDDEGRAILSRHLATSARRLWRLTATAQALESAGADARANATAAEIMQREKVLVEHILHVSGVITPAPDRAVQLMHGALAGDRYTASLYLEFLEDWIPADVRESLFPVLESYADPETRKKAAARLAPAPPAGLAPAELLDFAEKD